MKVKRVDERAARVRQTAVLAAVMVLAPMMLGIAFVALFKVLSVPDTAPQEAARGALTNRLQQVSQMNLCSLQLLRLDAREAGHDTAEIDICIWAASAQQPTELISVPPPTLDDKWSWALSADGGYAVATGSKADAAERRAVGLYDLKTDEWVWTNKFVWPDTHEMPHVFNRSLVLRYAKNNAKFAMEVSPDGKIASIDPLPPNAAFEMPRPPAPIAECPGQPVALMHNVFFVVDPSTWHLTGYAHRRLPGLYPAGKAEGHTRFSGNGRLKFQVGNGLVVVEDSWTQSVLLRFKLWDPSSVGLTVTGVTATPDGSFLTVIVETQDQREMSVLIDVVEGKASVARDTDAAFSKPPPERPATAVTSRDDRWAFAVTPDNGLAIAANTKPKREIARVPLGKLLGLRAPITHLTLLEGGNHLAIWSDKSVWLLHLPVMRDYASQMERIAVSADALANPPEEEEAEVEEADYYGMWLAAFKPSPPMAPTALHAEQLYQHQAWFYAVARFSACMAASGIDSRAPRINPLLFARASILAGQPKLAKAICRSALLALSEDRTEYNRMARYHLQALYFGDTP